MDGHSYRPNAEATIATWSDAAVEIDNPLRDRAAVTVPELGACMVVAACACVALAIAFGRDLNWDFFNYHLYSGLLLAHGRLAKDFFAAGYQGYMNPLPYLPLYLMTAAKWHSVVIGSAIATIQSLNLVFLYLISRRVVGMDPHPRAAAVLATVLGGSSGVVLGQLGSSFIDLTTAWPVMAAVWLLLLPVSSGRLVASGLLVGLAVGLKLTNIVFLVGAFVAAAALPALSWTSRAQRLALLCAGAVLGILATYGYWGFQLQRAFGSPVFPMFNQLFHAPDYASVAIQYDRFAPRSAWDLLGLPLRMVELRSWIYVENQAPDLRPIVALVLLTVLGARAALRAVRIRGVRVRESEPGRDVVSPYSPLRTLGYFFLGSLFAWVPTSSNGRYATPMLLLLGPLLYLLARQFLNARRVLVCGTLLLGLQAVHLHSAGNPHWSPTPWAPEWLPAEVPDSLRREPHLFLTVGASSESYVAAYVHPDSVFVNPIGMLSIATGGPGWDKLQELIDKNRSRIQVVFPSWPLAMPDAGRAEYLARRSALIGRLGLRLNNPSCQPLVFDASSDGIDGSDEPKQRGRHLVSCAAERLTQSDARLDAARATAEKIMNMIEDRCPDIFGPHRAQAEGSGAYFVRMYGKNDIFLVVSFAASEIFYRMEHQIVDTMIGHVDSIENDLKRFRCALPRDGARGV
jgi:hypothetical protein